MHTPLKTKQDVHRFFAYLLNDLELNFHPDTPFEDYINLESGQPSFTPAQQKQLNQRMDEAFKIAKGDNGDEIYQIAVEEFNKYQSQHGGLQLGEEEEFEMGGSLNKKLNWRAGKAFPDYYYMYNNGIIFVTHQKNLTDNLQIIDIDRKYRLVDKDPITGAVQPHQRQNYVEDMLSIFPELTKAEIIEAMENANTFAQGGHIGFKNLSKQVAAQYKGKRVAPEYQYLYGKTYSAAEAQEVGEKTAAKIKRLKERKQAHFATGGKLNYHHQISGSGKSLGEEIAELAGITTDSFYFDDTDLVSEKTSKTIVPEALNNKYTKPELVKLVIEKFTKTTGLPMVDLNIEIHESDAKIARHAGMSLAEYDKLNHKTKKGLAAKYFAQLRTFKDGGGLSGNVTYRYNHEAELPAPLHANLAKAQYGAPLYTFREAVTPDGSWYEVCTTNDQVLANTLDAATATDALLHMAKGGSIFSFLQGKKRNLSRDRQFISQQEWEKNLDRKTPGRRYKAEGGSMGDTENKVKVLGFRGKARIIGTPNENNWHYTAIYELPDSDIAWTDIISAPDIQTARQYFHEFLPKAKLLHLNEALAFGGKMRKRNMPQPPKYANVYWDVQVKVPYSAKVKHVVIELGPKSNEFDVKTTIERMKAAGHRDLTEGLILSVRNMGHEKPVFAAGGNLSNIEDYFTDEWSAVEKANIAKIIESLPTLFSGKFASFDSGGGHAHFFAQLKNSKWIGWHNVTAAITLSQQFSSVDDLEEAFFENDNMVTGKVLQYRGMNGDDNWAKTKMIREAIAGEQWKEAFAAGGHLSPELSMAKADLLKLQEYAEKIPALVADTDNVEPWITSAISKVEQTVAAVKHTVEAAQPEMFADGGNLQADGENLNGMLRHIGKYATALLAALDKGLQLESWMLHELAIAGSSIDEVYHKLDYKKSK